MKPIKKIKVPGENESSVEQQDVLISNAVGVTEYIAKNKDLFVKYGGFVAVIIAAFIAYFMYQNELSHEADGQLGIALVDLKNQEIEKAENKLTNITDDYSGSDAASRAHYYLATLSLSKSLVEQAYSHFSEVTSTDPLFYAPAQAGIALYYENKKEYEKASKFYLDAADAEERDEIKWMYEFSAAVNFELANNLDKAKEIFAELKNKKEFSKASLSELKYDMLTK